VFGSKAAEQRKSDAAAEARVKRARSVWEFADLSKRTSLLRAVIDTQDDSSWPTSMRHGLKYHTATR
jgi:hypothetical protein